MRYFDDKYVVPRSKTNEMCWLFITSTLFSFISRSGNFSRNDVVRRIISYLKTQFYVYIYIIEKEISLILEQLKRDKLRVRYKISKS